VPSNQAMKNPAPEKCQSTKMTQSSTGLPYRFLYDGVVRMMQLIHDQSFDFIVNGRVFESNLGEAVLISQKVSQILENDQSTMSLIIANENINANDFSKIQASVRGFPIEFNHES
jgi:hypothetical protein